MKSAMKLFGKGATKSPAIFLPTCGFALLCWTLFSPSFLGAQSTEQLTALPAPTPAGDSTGSTGEANLRVGAGDLLAVTVFDMPELAQNVRVNEVGDASFAFIGLLHVAGLTPDQTREAIASGLRDGNFVLHPQVSVLIQEYGTQGVSVLGQVQKPGVYAVLGSRTLLDVISQAGGTTALAGSSVTIKRHADGTILTIPLTRNAAQSLASDVQLLPGDKVIIPRASLIYVIGDVGRPGGFVMENDGKMTVLQAVALAGGQTRTAAMGHVRLIRRKESNYSDTEVSLKKIMNGQESDLELQPEDVLYVPNSAAKSVVYHGVPSILQSASNAAVYSAVP